MKEKEFSSWPTPRTCSAMTANITEKIAQAKHPNLETVIAKQMFPTPGVIDTEGGAQPDRIQKTSTGSYIKVSKNDKTKTHGAKLTDAILWEEKQKYPTPAARDYKGSNNLETTLEKINEGKLAHMNQLPNYIMVKEHTNKDYLNPYWVEALMGLPQGWTALDGTETEMQGTWANNSWEEGIPKVTKGCPNRIDRIRLCGNGVVPQTACIAWRILSGETENQDS